MELYDEVKVYESTLSDEDISSPTAKSAQTVQDWVVERTFPTLSEAMKEIRSEKTWSRIRSHDVDAGLSVQQGEGTCKSPRSIMTIVCSLLRLLVLNRL